MKKKTAVLIALLLAFVLLVLFVVGCGTRGQDSKNPEATEAPEQTAPMEDVTEPEEPLADPAELAAAEETPEPVQTAATPKPEAPKATEKPVTTPQPTEKPAPTPKPSNTTPTEKPHTHDWVPVTKTVHHDAVTEQVYVVDVPATEGWVEYIEYEYCQCRCGATFGSYGEWAGHSSYFDPEERMTKHSGWSGGTKYDEIWHEGTPEQGHYETKVVTPAYDEEVITGYKCSGCGATK